MFLDMLRTQLLLKGVIAMEEWQTFKEHIQFDFLQDGHFTELKNAEILRDRLDMLGQVESYVGQYFSCLLYTSPSPRDRTRSRMPSSA